MSNTDIYTVRSEQLLNPPLPFLQIHAVERSRQFFMERHTHEFYQNIYVTEGKLLLITDEVTEETADEEELPGRIPIEAGQLGIISPGVPHALYSRDGYTQIGIDLPKEESDPGGLISLWRESFSQPVTVLPVALSHLRFDHFFYTMRQFTRLSELKTINLAEQLLLSALESRQSRPASGARDRFMKLMDEENAYLLSLEECCQRMHMSRSNLERMVHQEFQCGVIEYRNRVKLSRALRLLQYTDMTISSIGMSLGFYDESHFNRFFKDKMRMTPREYRRSCSM